MPHATGVCRQDLFPPTPEYLNRLLQTQNRHLRLASIAATEIRDSWGRVQTELARQAGIQGIINIGDGDIITETQAANSNLRAQIISLRHQLQQAARSQQQRVRLATELFSTIKGKLDGLGEVSKAELARMADLASELMSFR